MLDRLLTARAGPREIVRPPRLLAAMRHGVLNGGKRMRPLLVMESAALFDADRQDALRVAAALECVHCYSLIHDDLPSMDNDDLRRGQPTVHRAFDEATAILAGDSLLTLAFDVLASTESGLTPAAVSNSSPALRAPQASAAWPAARRSTLPPQARRPTSRHHHAASHEDRRADPLCLRSRRDCRRCQLRPIASGSANSARQSGLPSSLPTTCSTCRPTPAPWARRPARTRLPARPRLPRSTVRTGRAASSSGLVAQAQALLEPFGERARLLNAAARFVADRRR